MEKYSGSSASTSSVKDSTALESTWESVCGQLKALDFGSSSAGGFFALHPAKATQLFLTMPAIHFDMVCRLRTAIGLYLDRYASLEKVKNRTASGFADTAFRLSEAAAAYAEIADMLFQLSHELYPDKRARSRKSRRKKSTRGASGKKSAKPKA